MRLPRIDQLAGIHSVVRIPQMLELAECFHQLGAEHLRQQCAARLAVAVLDARDRPAMCHDDVGRAIDEFAELLDAGIGLQVEVDAHVHAPFAEMAAQRTVVVVFTIRA